MNPPTSYTQLVSFQLAGAAYALEITQVKEVILPAGITRVPQMPACIAGVINLRGVVLPVVDLRRRFGLAAATADERTRILIARPEGRLVGFIVDAVSQVLKLPTSEIQPPPPNVIGIGRRYLRGIAQHQERMLLMIELTAVLDPEELRAIAA